MRVHVRSTRSPRPDRRIPSGKVAGSPARSRKIEVALIPRIFLRKTRLEPRIVEEPRLRFRAAHSRALVLARRSVDSWRRIWGRKWVERIRRVRALSPSAGDPPRRLPRSRHYRAGMPVGGSAVNSAPASRRLYVSPGERHFEPVIVYITGNERGLR